MQKIKNGGGDEELEIKSMGSKPHTKKRKKPFGKHNLIKQYQTRTRKR